MYFQILTKGNPFYCSVLFHFSFYWCILFHEYLNVIYNYRHYQTLGYSAMLRYRRSIALFLRLILVTEWWRPIKQNEHLKDPNLCQDSSLFLSCCFPTVMLSLPKTQPLGRVCGGGGGITIHNSLCNPVSKQMLENFDLMVEGWKWDLAKLYSHANSWLCVYVILMNSKFLFSLNHHKPRSVPFSKKTCLKTAANPGSFLRCFFPPFFFFT